MNIGCYVTAVAFRREAILARPDVAAVILEEIEFYRKKFGYRFCGFVIMPDHFHFVMITDESIVSSILRDLKSMIARMVVDKWKEMPGGHALLERVRLSREVKGNHRYSLWQEGNWKVVLEEAEQIERRLEYMHANPLRAGLVKRPEDWTWSSYRWYQFREEVGVPIDMDWI